MADLSQLTDLARRWTDGNVLDRILDHLDRVFGESTGLSAAQLESWKDDEGFCSVVFATAYTADWERWRGDMRAEILRLISNADPSDQELNLADQVVAEIEAFMADAQQGDELIRYVGRQNILTSERANVRLLRADLAPERAKELLEELAKKSASEAAAFEDAIKDRDIEVEIPALVRVPPRWLQEGSGLLWEVVAASAEGIGRWSEALAAWDEAFERTGSDRVRTRVRGSLCAHVSGDAERGHELLAEAETLDPTHPLLLFTKAQHADDPEDTLAILDTIEPRKEGQAGLRQARRAKPLARLGRFDEAKATLEKSAQDEVAELELRELRADVALEANKPSWLKGRRTDTKALREAADAYLELRDKHRELKAYEGAVAYLMQAIEALIYADQRHEAAELMAVDSLLDEELGRGSTRAMLGEQLVKIGRAEQALDLLAGIEDPDDDARLIEAMARTQLGEDQDEDELQETIAYLEELISTGPHELPAANTRLIMSLRGLAEWSEDAYARLVEHDAGFAALFKARHLANGERRDEAERALQPHMAEPRIQHALLEIATDRGDDQRVILRAEEILEQDSDFAVRLDAANALASAGESQSAEKELAALVATEAAPLPIRLAALPHLAELLTKNERHRELLDLTERWLELDPYSDNAVWGRAHSLFRLGRHQECLELLEEKGGKPATMARRQLLARAYGLVVGGGEAAKKIVALAEEHGEPDETLEALAIFAALESGGEGLSEELKERVSPGRFTQAFPESGLIRTVRAPQSREEIIAMLEELGGGDQHERVSRATELIFENPTAPLGLIGLALGKPVAEIWRQVNRRPTNFGIAQLDEDERANAANALTIGAVWDASSTFIAARLGQEELFRSVLTKSATAQSVLDDILASGGQPTAGGEHMTIGLGATGEPWATTWSEEDVRQDIEIAEQMRESAATLFIEPDQLPSDSGPEVEALSERDLEPQLLGFVATLNVARRLRLPVFSDDRFIRLRARQAGLRAFGSQALLDALADRGDITTAQRFEGRRKLRSLGATGMWPSNEELVEEARASEFRLTKALALTFRDATPLKTDLGRAMLAYIEFLRAVEREAPQALDVWTARLIDIMCQTFTLLSAAQHGSRYLALSWGPEEEDRAFIRALAKAIKRAASALDHRRGDPVVAAARLLNEALRPQVDLPTRIRLIGHFADCLEAPDSLHARLVVLE